MTENWARLKSKPWSFIFDFICWLILNLILLSPFQKISPFYHSFFRYFWWIYIKKVFSNRTFSLNLDPTAFKLIRLFLLFNLSFKAVNHSPNCREYWFCNLSPRVVLLSNLMQIFSFIFGDFDCNLIDEEIWFQQFQYFIIFLYFKYDEIDSALLHVWSSWIKFKFYRTFEKSMTLISNFTNINKLVRWPSL